jgi:hypothetical protein
MTLQSALNMLVVCLKLIGLSEVALMTFLFVAVEHPPLHKVAKPMNVILYITYPLMTLRGNSLIGLAFLHLHYCVLTVIWLHPMILLAKPYSVSA